MPLRIRRGARACAFLFLTLASAAEPADLPERAAYVLGANDGSVARVDLDTGAVASNVLAVGAGGNRVAVDANGSRAALVNSALDVVVIIDLTTESVSASVPLAPGSNPWGAVWSGDRIFVSSLLRDSVYEIDSRTAAVVDSVTVGKSPEGLAVAAGRLYVANTGFDFATFSFGPGSVSVIEVDPLGPWTTIPVSTNPQECLLAPGGTVHVVCTGDFGDAEGSIDVIDPAAGAVTASLAVPGYPGGGCVGGARVLLNLTTTAFASEVRAYDARTLAWEFDETNPLLPSLDFYGNVRATSLGAVLVCDFSADLLLVERPEAPGHPHACLVGDGPIDAAVVERGGPVALPVSGLYATDTPLGVLLGWNAAVELGIVACTVERSDAGEGWREVAHALAAAPRCEWTDRSAPTNLVLRYRVAALTTTGANLLSTTVAITRRGRESGRLALRRVVPNPSRKTARFDLFAPRAGSAKLELFDVAGRRVRSMAWETRGGETTLPWDGRDERGRELPPGAYFARVTVGDETVSARMTRLR